MNSSAISLGLGLVARTTRQQYTIHPAQPLWRSELSCQTA